jgi:hypothetical protein
MIRPLPSRRAAWHPMVVTPVLVALALLGAEPAAAQSLSFDLAGGGPPPPAASSNCWRC